MKRILIYTALATLLSGCALVPGWFWATQNVQNVRMVALGNTHGLLMDAVGNVYGAGINNAEQIGGGLISPLTSFTPCFYNASMIAAGHNHSLVLDQQGRLWGSGTNDVGQLGISPGITQIKGWEPLLDGVRSVFAYGNKSYAVKNDNTLWVAGENTYGSFGRGDSLTTVPVWEVVPISDVKKIVANDYVSFVLKNDNTLWVSGENVNSEMGNSTLNQQYTWFQVASDVQDVACGYNFSLFVSMNGKVYASGDNSYGQLGDTAIPSSTQNWTEVMAADAVQVAAGYYHSYVLDHNGDVWGSGENTAGQLGDGSMSSIYNWTIVHNGVDQVYAAYNSGIILYHQTKFISVTGDNLYYQLGWSDPISLDSWLEVHLGPEPASTGL